jgi:HEAT repeat protein
LAEDDITLNFDDVFKGRLKDPDEEVRSKAIEGLWECEELSVIDPLARLLEEDSSETVRATAAEALGKFAMLAELGKLRDTYASRVIQALLKVIADNNNTKEVRRRSLEAAAPLSLPQVTQAITESYHSGDFSLEVSAIYAMGKNCDPSWLPILLKELDSDSAEKRYEAAGACGELGEEEAIHPLVKLIDDNDTEVRLAAIQSLGKIGGSEAAEFLEYYLKSSDDMIAASARDALNELRMEEDLFSL